LGDKHWAILPSFYAVSPLVQPKHVCNIIPFLLIIVVQRRFTVVCTYIRGDSAKPCLGLVTEYKNGSIFAP
jgi:hypothetical protein